MATVTHSSLTGANLHEPKGVASATIGTVYVANGSASGAWVGLVPIGAVTPYAGTSAPSRWLFCYGQAISRTTYSALFTALSTTYGVGDGSTTFNLPDLRGRVVAGQDDMGGTSANRLTGITGSVDGDTLGTTGGNEDHSHGPGTLGGTTEQTATGVDVQAGGGKNVPTAGHLHLFTATTGTTDTYSSLQPTIILNYIIYTGVA